MPSYVTPVGCLHDYQGIPGLVEYTNGDGAIRDMNCGQAAVATVLLYLDGTLPQPKLMPWLERDHPPDNLGGWFGTSRRRVERGLRAQGHRPKVIHGEAALRATLTRQIPVIFTSQLSDGKFWGFDIPNGHWMVAFGFDRDHIYLTNWWDNRMPWPEFLKGWFGWVPALTCMRGTGIVVPS